MLCLVSNGLGGWVAANPQPATYTECLNILAEPGDVTAGAFVLSAADGATLASAILGLWAVAAVFRIAISMMRSSAGENVQNE